MCEKTEVVNVSEALGKSKNKFFRNLPRFVVKRIEKIVRQDQYNALYLKFCHLQGMDFIKSYLFKEFKIKMNIVGEEKIPKDKLFIYVANHPLGGIDALSLLYLIDKLHGKVISPSNELFENIPNLKSLIVGVNVFGHNTRAKVMALNTAFESDAQIMLFPAGEVSRKIKGKIQDPKWQKSFVSKAIEYKRDIVPVFISGHNSNKFYTIAKLRKLLGIKTYIETLLLPQELLKQYNFELDLIIGDPIDYREIEKSDASALLWAENIREVVYNLEKK